MAAGRSACRFFSNSSRSPTVCGRNTSGTPPRVRVSPSFTGPALSPAVPLTACRPWSQDHTPSRLRLHHGTAPHAAGRCWIVQNRIGGFTPPQNIFPVGQGILPPPLAGSTGPRPPACGGIRSRDRMARTRISAESTGNSSRAMAVYQPRPEDGHSATGTVQKTVPASHSLLSEKTASDRTGGVCLRQPEIRVIIALSQ